MALLGELVLAVPKMQLDRKFDRKSWEELNMKQSIQHLSEKEC